MHAVLIESWMEEAGQSCWQELPLQEGAPQPQKPWKPSKRMMPTKAPRQQHDCWTAQMQQQCWSMLTMQRKRPLVLQ
jgi:hypothetical protein